MQSVKRNVILLFVSVLVFVLCWVEAFLISSAEVTTYHEAVWIFIQIVVFTCGVLITPVTFMSSLMGLVQAVLSMRLMPRKKRA